MTATWNVDYLKVSYKEPFQVKNCMLYVVNIWKGYQGEKRKSSFLFSYEY